MEHIDVEDTKIYFKEMDPQFASAVFTDMPADDAVDILNELDKDMVASFLTIMDKTAAEEVKALLHYEEKTAGSIMTPEYIAFMKHETVQEAMQTLKVNAPDAETIYYLYELHEDQQLAGVLSFRDLILVDENVRIEEVIDDQVFSVSVGRDQEEVAHMLRNYNFLALPVVDFQNHLLGIITFDDVIDVLDEEASDDYSKFAADRKSTRLNSSHVAIS